MIDLVVHRRAHGANAERAASGGSPARPSRPPVSRAHAGVAKAGKAGACDPAAVSRPAAALCPAFARLLPRARRGPPPETHSGRFRPQRILLYRLLWRLVKRTAGRRAERRRRESARDRPLCPARARSGGRPCRLCGAGALPPERRGATARRHRTEQKQAGQRVLADEPVEARGRAKPGQPPGLLPMRNGQGKTVVIIAHGPVRQTHAEGGAPAARLRGRAGRTARREADARFRIRHVRRYGRRPQEKCGKRAPGRTADGKKGPGGVTPPGPVFQPLNRSMRDQYTLRLT